VRRPSLSARVRPATGASRAPLVVQLVGTHGAGKTLTLTQVVRALRARGRSVAVVKHSHHAIDVAGTDTDRLTRSGADAVVFASGRTVAFLPLDAVEFTRSLGTDVILVEGYHRRKLGTRFRIRAPAESADVARKILAHLLRHLRRRREPRVG
jgi:molybdopterin-guanine dinucleotide biosynthesis adapter protein